jgi:molybdopterin-dependent oxidoreductase alpha subunit
VSINPLREAGTFGFIHPQHVVATVASQPTPLAKIHLGVRINGDVALLQGMGKAILEAEDARPGEVLDHAFLGEHTHGFEAYAGGVRARTWAEIEEASGVSEAEIRHAADVAVRSQRTIACWAMGLTQHKNAVANVQEIVNVLLLRGQIGKRGAGVCPIRGHSNVQGDRTMGIYEQMSEWFLAAVEKEFGFRVPRAHGMDTVGAIEAMLAGRAKVFFALGGNFLSAAPDTLATARALRNCRLTAHVSTKLHRSHLVTGRRALILPCLGRSEIDRQASGPQWVTTENSMGVVQSSEGRLPPASDQLLSEPAIVARLAKAVVPRRADWDALVADYGHLRTRIENVVPGFERYNERASAPGGFHLPNSAKDRVWRTESGKAQFTVHDLPRHALRPGQLMMMTIRSHDQFNTTVYGLDDRYRGVKNGRRVVFLHEADIADAGFAPGDLVDLVSEWDDGERVAHAFRIVPYEIPRRCAATYFPETNVLVPLGNYADKSRTPASKSIVIRLRAAAPERAT